MRIYTIGFTKKTAEVFFRLLRDNNVKSLFDIRLNNVSQLAGFAKGKDLEFFLKEILNIEYIHNIKLSPTKEILDDYKNARISWEQYEERFKDLLETRNIREFIKKSYLERLDGMCFLCSEDTSDKCHRRLVAEFIQSEFEELKIEIKHL